MLELSVSVEIVVATVFRIGGLLDCFLVFVYILCHLLCVVVGQITHFARVAPPANGSDVPFSDPERPL